MNFNGIVRHVAACALSVCCLSCAPAAADDGAYQNALRLLSEGRTEEARSAFEAIISQQEEHAGARLDLAILQCGMGMREEAEVLFEQILARFDPPPAIRELIQKIRARGCQQQTPERLFGYQFKLGRGHDSNANQGAANPFSLGGLPLAPEFRPQSDDFTQMNLEATTLLTRYGTTLHAQVQTRQHDHLSGYNLTSGLFVAEQSLRPKGWETHLGIMMGATRLGSHLYQKQIGTYAQISPPWPVLPSGWRYSIVSDLSRVWYPTLEHFDSNVARNQLVLNFRDGNTQLTANAGILRDFGAAARPGGDKYGWSASLTWRQRLGQRFIGELSWTRQEWQGKEIYFSGLVDTNTKRNQRPTLWRAALTYPLNARHSLVLEYRDLENTENISLFSYHSKQLMLNWQYAK
ncbi:MAG: tetratricopeptide repeat protein [Zoogloeaceae bacterium]|jgi:hypothetical protein|nr:tetratricopeptide repeat protein [Zoogloeaceae bacterium]